MNQFIEAFRSSHLMSTMIGGSFMFGGVLFLLLGIPHTAQIGYDLLTLTPIPSVIYWVVKKEVPTKHERNGVSSK